MFIIRSYHGSSGKVCVFFGLKKNWSWDTAEAILKTNYRTTIYLMGSDLIVQKWTWHVSWKQYIFVQQEMSTQFTILATQSYTIPRTQITICDFFMHFQDFIHNLCNFWLGAVSDFLAKMVLSVGTLFDAMPVQAKSVQFLHTCHGIQNNQNFD